MRTARNTLLSAIAFLLLLPSVSRASVDEMVSDAVSKIQPTLGKISDDMKVVAVYSITGDKSGKVNLENLQDRIIGVLLKTEKFQVIDRANLKRLLEEQALSMTGVVDEAQMVKAGKLIGVKGFFFGTVDVREESVVISLKLVSVETSAIVWSKDFVGEAASAAKLGIGWGVMSSGFGMDYKFNAINQNVAADGNFTELDSGNGLTGSGVTFINLLVSYRQGIRGFSLGQVGCDLGYSFFSNEEAINHKQLDSIDTWNSAKSQWGGSINMSVTRVALRPKLFLSMKNMLGWESDWLVPYLGASVDYYMFNIANEVHKVGGSPVQQQDEKSAQVVLVSPLLGAEFSPARSISLFAEVIYVLGGDADMTRSKPLNEIHVDAYPKIESGVTFQAGVKYNFTLGGGSGK
jgi:TolB-like protein